MARGNTRGMLVAILLHAEIAEMLKCYIKVLNK